jgi:hypothetical protein
VPSFGGYFPKSAAWSAITCATHGGKAWRGSPMVIWMTSPPGECASRSLRRRGNAYSGRFENRSGKLIIASGPGSSRPVRGKTSRAAPSGPEKSGRGRGVRRRLWHLRQSRLGGRPEAEKRLFAHRPPEKGNAGGWDARWQGKRRNPHEIPDARVAERKEVLRHEKRRVRRDGRDLRRQVWHGREKHGVVGRRGRQPCLPKPVQREPCGHVVGAPKALPPRKRSRICGNIAPGFASITSFHVP